MTYHIVTYDDSTFYMDLCLEEFNEDSPIPNVCKMWEAISFELKTTFAFIGLIIFSLLL